MRIDHRLSPLEEAENCRRKAVAYLGKPEASFLLRIAEAFEELEAWNAEGRARRQRSEQHR